MVLGVPVRSALQASDRQSSNSKGIQQRGSTRIERLALRLSQFDYTIEHHPGERNEVDYFRATRTRLPTCQKWKRNSSTSKT